MQTRSKIFIRAMVLIGLFVSLSLTSLTLATRNCVALQILRIVQGQASPGTADRAIAWGEQMLQRTPADRVLRRLLGRLYIQNQQAQLASNVLQATMIDCTDAITCFEQGWALYQLGQYQAAVAKWRSTPNMDLYFAYQGNTAYARQDKENALEWYALSWEIARSPSPGKVIMFLNLCREQRNDKNMEVAIAWCLQAVASNRSYWNLVELGRTYYEARQYALAEEASREAINEMPTQASAYQWLGLSLYRLGQKEQALEALYTSVQLAPQNVWIRLDLGSVLQCEGEYLLAACEYTKALTLTDRETLIAEIQDKLESLPVTQTDLSRCDQE